MGIAVIGVVTYISIFSFFTPVTCPFYAKITYSGFVYPVRFFVCTE